MVRGSEWFGYYEEMVPLVAHWHTTLMYFTYMNIMMGTLRREYELYADATATREEEIAAQGAVREEDNQVPNRAPAAQPMQQVDENVAEQPTPARPRKQVDLKKLRKQSKDTCEFVGKVLANHQLRETVGSAVSYTHKLGLRMSECQAIHKTASSILAAAPQPAARSHRAAAAGWRKRRLARWAEACKSPSPQSPAANPCSSRVIRITRIVWDLMPRAGWRGGWDSWAAWNSDCSQSGISQANINTKVKENGHKIFTLE
jgi:hypothetical protein